MTEDKMSPRRGIIQKQIIHIGQPLTSKTLCGKCSEDLPPNEKVAWYKDVPNCPECLIIEKEGMQRHHDK